MGLNSGDEFFDDGMSFRQRRAQQLRIEEIKGRMAQKAGLNAPINALSLCWCVVHASLKASAIFLALLAIYLACWLIS